MKIGLVGKMRSGKDTVAGIIEEYARDNQRSFGHYKFASGIYRIVEEYGYRDYRVKPRRELQEIGQSLRNILGEDVWVNHTLNQIDNDLEIVVISDVRQENELLRLKQEGYVLIGVNRPFRDRYRTMSELGESLDKLAVSHETENIDLEMVDVLVENKGTVEDLRQGKLAVYKNMENWVNFS